MNVYDTYDLAKFCGVAISLNPDKLTLVVAPKERITQELREAIKENRDRLIQDLLFQQATRYVAGIASRLRPIDARDVFSVFDSKAESLEGSPKSPEEVKAVLKAACAAAREEVVQINNTMKRLEANIE